MQHSLGGCDRWGEGRGVLYFEASVVQWKDTRAWRPEYGPEGKHFVSGLFFYFGECNEAAMDGGGVRSAPFGEAMSSKDGCAHARPKPTSSRISYATAAV